MERELQKKRVKLSDVLFYGGVVLLFVLSQTVFKDDLVRLINSEPSDVIKGEYSSFFKGDPEVPFILYTYKGCNACKELKAHLALKDISYEEREVSGNKTYAEDLTSLEIERVPVFMLRDKLIIGNNPDLIDIELEKITKRS